MISYSCFSDLTADNGAAIFQNFPRNLNILCCIFHDNRVTTNGGSIYFEKGILNITNTAFTKSYSTAAANNVGGNALYQDSSETVFKHVSAYLCAIKREESGDSTFTLKGTDGKIEYLNSTSNSGHDGSSSISLYAKSSASYAKFLNIIKPGDGYSIESMSLKYTVSKSNFVGFDQQINIAVVYEVQDGLFKFEDCCFFETNSIPFSFRGRKCEIVNCFSDYNNQDFTYKTQITTHNLNNNMHLQHYST